MVSQRARQLLPMVCITHVTIYLNNVRALQRGLRRGLDSLFHNQR
jgi:hypothetical protein